MNTVSNFEKFLDSPPAYRYKTEHIGDVRKKPFDDGTVSTFNNVIESIGNINQDLANDLRTS